MLGEVLQQCRTMGGVLGDDSPFCLVSTCVNPNITVIWDLRKVLGSVVAVMVLFLPLLEGVVSCSNSSLSSALHHYSLLS